MKITSLGKHKFNPFNPCDYAAKASNIPVYIQAARHSDFSVHCMQERHALTTHATKNELEKIRLQGEINAMNGEVKKARESLKKSKSGRRHLAIADTQQRLVDRMNLAGA